MTFAVFGWLVLVLIGLFVSVIGICAGWTNLIFKGRVRVYFTEFVILLIGFFILYFSFSHCPFVITLVQ